LTTELALAASRGRIVDRGDYLVVSTPTDPGYYYGNLLVLPAPPQVGEVAYWSRRFTEELGENPAIRHVTLWWDGTTGDLGAADELRAAGFITEVSQVMRATPAEQLAPAPTLARIQLRALTADEVLATHAIAWSLADRHDDAYRTFLRRRAEWQRGMVVRGAAQFWGAIDPDGLHPPLVAGGQLVASVGIVAVDRLARYQDVQVIATHRGHGIAAALLAAAARAVAADSVVIVAEPNSRASRVYERAGFRTVELTASACRHPIAVERSVINDDDAAAARE
jgi:GNAT superfamily N-acetyltransferase